MPDATLGRVTGNCVLPPWIPPPVLPWVHGAARLTTMAYHGHTLEALLDLIGPPPAPHATHWADEQAAWLLDRSLAHAVFFRTEEAAALQRAALSLAQAFQIRGGGTGPRLLLLMAPGDLMANAPLDFLTVATDIQLILLFLPPNTPLPDPLPQHDVALVAASESAPDVLAKLAPLFDRWQRPILNRPDRIATLSRDGVASRLHPLPGVASPATLQATRARLLADGPAVLPGGAYPVLLRPLHSHAGNGLVKCDGPEDIAAFLVATRGSAFFVTQFVDYRGTDGWYRKYRIAFVDGRPFLCHMAASEDWMVHYLNAGMADNAAKRSAEAHAMAHFDAEFATRHATALAALAQEIGLDYVSIDCGETQDGRLLVFEVDVAAIIHFMDPPSLFPYKAAPMQRCADAFAHMLARRC